MQSDVLIDRSSRSRTSWVATVAAATLVLTGCPATVVQQTATAIAHSEQLDFNYVLLDANADNRYPLRLDVGHGCEEFLPTEAELAALLRDRQGTYTHYVARSLVTGTGPFTSDMVDRCYPAAHEVVFDNDALSQPMTDAGGNVTGRSRRMEEDGITPVIHVRLSGDGHFQVRMVAGGINLIGVTASGSKSPGPVMLDTAELEASRINAGSGTFVKGAVDPEFAYASIRDVLSDPNRFTGEFAFLAKRQRTDRQLLLVWDGDFVLRTDL